MTFELPPSLLDRLAEPTLGAELKKQEKRVILFWLAGGASQLETFDPKPAVALSKNVPYEPCRVGGPGE